MNTFAFLVIITLGMVLFVIFRHLDRKKLNAEIDKRVEEEVDPVHNGRVAFFNDSKGFGFINDLNSQEKYFVHVNGLMEEIRENDKVSFELERGMKGMNAAKVKKIK